MQQKTFTLDQLDHQLIQALQLDGRVPFARLAQLVDVSEQTVARRFRRLRTAGVIRVLGLVSPTPLGESSWIVRIQSRPDAAVALAEALARRPDAGWVSLTSGGSEIICVVWSRTSRQRDELLLQRLPKTAQVNGFSAHAILHRFDDVSGWTTGSGQLSPAQVESLLAHSIGGGARSGAARLPAAGASSVAGESVAGESVPVPQLGPQDELLLAELAADGRAPVVRLAAITGWPPARVHRRLEELVRSGLLYFDVDLAVQALGFRSQAYLWLTVGAADLHATGEALARHDVVAFAAVTTGSSNLIAAVTCRDNAHLYRYVTEELGTLKALPQVEISPILRRVKQSGSLMANDRLTLS